LNLFYNNLIDGGSVLITASSEASTSLSASNVAHEHKSKVWRTGTSTAAEYILFDLASAQDVTSVIIFAHTLTGSDSTIQLRASTDNFAASDVLVSALTYAETISATFSTATYRYWKIVFTKSASGESRDIGRIFLGTYYATEIQPDWDGLKIDRKDLSVKSKSAGGQTYTDQRPQYRSPVAEFSSVSTTMKDALVTVTDSVGTHTSLFIQVDSTASTEVSEILYVKFNEAAGCKASGVGSDDDITWDLKLDFEEQV
jgi:hypothetical protein